MRNRSLIYGILISIAIHFIFLSNIKFNISNNKSLDIQLVQLPPEISKDDLSPLKNVKKESIKKFKKDNINKRVKEKKRKYIANYVSRSMMLMNSSQSQSLGSQ